VAGMRTETAVMAQTAQHVNDVADQLTTMLSTLMTNLDPLLTAWQGAGGSAFQGVRERFNTDMARLNAALRTIAGAVGSSGTHYGASDEQTQAEVTRSGAGAGGISQALMAG
jgi:WXG100 family type VII secretion target